MKYTDRCLYLDDTRTPVEDRFDVVRTFEAFQEYILTNGIPKYISFDHDLSEEHMQDYFSQQRKFGFQVPSYSDYKTKTGYDCALWLCKYIDDCNQEGIPLELQAVGVHSHNPVGAKNIQETINAFKTYMGWTPDCFIAKHEFIIEPQNNKSL